MLQSAENIQHLLHAFINLDLFVVYVSSQNRPWDHASSAERHDIVLHLLWLNQARPRAQDGDKQNWMQFSKSGTGTSAHSLARYARHILISSLAHAFSMPCCYFANLPLCQYLTPPRTRWSTWPVASNSAPRYLTGNFRTVPVEGESHGDGLESPMSPSLMDHISTRQDTLTPRQFENPYIRMEGTSDWSSEPLGWSEFYKSNRLSIDH
jgi:hypothetical protein